MNNVFSFVFPKDMPFCMYRWVLLLYMKKNLIKIF